MPLSSWTCSSAVAGLARQAPTKSARFEATLLQADSRGRPGGHPATPREGSRVIVQGTAEGLLLQDCPIVVAPTSYVDPVFENSEHRPFALRLSGLYPVWSVTLQLGSQKEADNLEALVLGLALAATSRMHRERAAVVGQKAVVGPRLYPESDAAGQLVGRQLICGTHVLRMCAHDRDQVAVGDLPEPTMAYHWLELWGSLASGDVTTMALLYYDGYGPGSQLILNYVVDKRHKEAWNPEVLNHVLIVGRKDNRSGLTPSEMPRLEFLAFRSKDEAAAFYDLVLAAKKGNVWLLREARDAMQQATDKLQREAEAPSTLSSCWPMDPQPLAPAVPAPSAALLELRRRQKEEQDRENAMVMAALEESENDQKHWMANRGSMVVSGTMVYDAAAPGTAMLG